MSVCVSVCVYLCIGMSLCDLQKLLMWHKNHLMWLTSWYWVVSQKRRCLKWLSRTREAKIWYFLLLWHTQRYATKGNTVTHNQRKSVSNTHILPYTLFTLAPGRGALYDPYMAYFVFSLCGLLCVSPCVAYFVCVLVWLTLCVSLCGLHNTCCTEWKSW